MEWWIWVIIWAVVLLGSVILEVLTADLNSIWFAGSAAICLILSSFKVQDWIQIVTFIVISIILIIATRPLTKKLMEREIVKTNTDKYVGMIATVITSFNEDSIGEVRVDNTVWRAVNRDGLSFKEGEKVLVEGISGNKLIVNKTDKQDFDTL